MLDLSRFYFFRNLLLCLCWSDNRWLWRYCDFVIPFSAQMASVSLCITGPLYLALGMGLLISCCTIQRDKQQDPNPGISIKFSILSGG
jgi:hypothetical protein